MEVHSKESVPVRVMTPEKEAVENRYNVERNVVHVA